MVQEAEGVRVPALVANYWNSAEDEPVEGEVILKYMYGDKVEYIVTPYLKGGGWDLLKGCELGVLVGWRYFEDRAPRVLLSVE